MDASFQRARSADAKRQRETAILDVARRLAERDGTREVTLTGIAEEIGMHKSALLRYFETREQIFLRLTAAGWQDWSGDVRARLDALADPSPETVAAVLAATLVARPLFCDLLAQAPLNLERNVSIEAVREFKLAVLAEVALVSAAIARVAGLDPAEAGDVMAAATSLAGALWQMATPSGELALLYRSDPRMAHAVVDIEPRLARTLAAMIRGSR